MSPSCREPFTPSALIHQIFYGHKQSILNANNFFLFSPQKTNNIYSIISFAQDALHVCDFSVWETFRTSGVCVKVSRTTFIFKSAVMCLRITNMYLTFLYYSNVYDGKIYGVWLGRKCSFFSCHELLEVCFSKNSLHLTIFGNYYYPYFTILSFGSKIHDFPDFEKRLGSLFKENRNMGCCWKTMLSNLKLHLWFYVCFVVLFKAVFNSFCKVLRQFQ